MDLPDKTPAGSYFAPIFKGGSAVLAQNTSESGHPDAAGLVVTPVITKAVHNLGRMATAAARINAVFVAND